MLIKALQEIENVIQKFRMINIDSIPELLIQDDNSSSRI
jgi:hypothetical protein